METLLVRIDHFHDRGTYVATLRGWLEELGIGAGRLVTMGDTHLLLVQGPTAAVDGLLGFYASRTIDTNARDEPCLDKFFDVVTRMPIDAPNCKGFLEMNLLNRSLLDKMVVGEWNIDKSTLDEALSTPRTRAMLAWREAAKAARKDRRKRAAQDRDTERAAKKAKQAAEKAEDEAAATSTTNKEATDESPITPEDAVAPSQTMKPLPTESKPQSTKTTPSTTPGAAQKKKQKRRAHGK